MSLEKRSEIVQDRQSARQDPGAKRRSGTSLIVDTDTRKQKPDDDYRIITDPIQSPPKMSQIIERGTILISLKPIK